MMVRRKKKFRPRESIFYVWDKLGFNVAIDEKTNTVNQINLYPIQYTKLNIEYKLIDMNKGPQIANESSSIEYVDPSEKWKVDNYQVLLERQPKEEFKGKFTYDGNTADFSKIGYTDWEKMVSDLHVGSSDYDPAGDSKAGLGK